MAPVKYRQSFEVIAVDGLAKLAALDHVLHAVSPRAMCALALQCKPSAHNDVS